MDKKKRETVHVFTDLKTMYHLFYRPLGGPDAAVGLQCVCVCVIVKGHGKRRVPQSAESERKLKLGKPVPATWGKSRHESETVNK